MSEELMTPKMIELLKSFIGRDNGVNLVISPRYSHLKTQALAEGWLVPSDRPMWYQITPAGREALRRGSLKRNLR